MAYALIRGPIVVAPRNLVRRLAERYWTGVESAITGRPGTLFVVFLIAESLFLHCVLDCTLSNFVLRKDPNLWRAKQTPQRKHRTKLRHSHLYPALCTLPLHPLPTTQQSHLLQNTLSLNTTSPFRSIYNHRQQSHRPEIPVPLIQSAPLVASLDQVHVSSYFLTGVSNESSSLEPQCDEQTTQCPTASYKYNLAGHAPTLHCVLR